MIQNKKKHLTCVSWQFSQCQMFFCCCVSEFLWIKAHCSRTLLPSVNAAKSTYVKTTFGFFFLMTDDRQKLILVLRNAFLCSRSTDAHSKYGHRKCRDTSMPLNTVGCMAIKRWPFCGQPIVKQSVLRRLIVTVYTRVSNMAGRVNR